MISDSESESELERCSSVKSAPETFESVPETKEIPFKMFGSSCPRKGTNFMFTLKEGKTLPYWTTTITKKGLSKQIYFE